MVIATGPTPLTRHAVGDFHVGPQYVVDVRDQPPDMFVDHSVRDWSKVSWRDIGRPYRVEKWSREKRDYERTHGAELPILDGWKKFNANFHAFFAQDVPAAGAAARAELAAAMKTFDVHGAREAVEEMLHLLIWNRIHRVEDAVWDPRGKRALFDGLDVKKPRILFLGAADGYEAMQLAAMYPGGHTVLVDYDEFCKTDRFGKFPEQYPFLGADLATGHKRVWYREEMDISFEVEDIRNLRYGREFDVVVSIGLIEHFPDEHKPLAFEFHRRFVKPGGYVIMTTPRDQLRSRAWYYVMSDLLNYGYRELMTVEQMALYARENGFDILRAGVIKAHNGIVCKVRQ
ncbi:MAG: methyltransferase domain-containing protein [Gemmatimonadetes bacterium]|nr:methyltransferase domain-containing protein [Gemmatimonadota bacterium]